MQHDNICSLYRLQDEILSVLSEFAKEQEFPFVLTGGTALIRFFFKNSYRVSYDLDFFSDKLDVFKNWKEIESKLRFFLSQKFQIVEFINYSSPSLKIWRGVVGNTDILVNIDFVDDQFSGIFKTVPLRGFPFLKVETADEGIYFRKVFAVITGVENEKVVKRIKDIVDLIQLSKKEPFPEFVEHKFIPIMKENFGLLDIEKFLTKFNLLYKVISKNEKEVAVLLQESLFTRLTVQEILNWIEKTSNALGKHFL
jgi:predicted nucleotidyltransferase component of viral defense system